MNTCASECRTSCPASRFFLSLYVPIIMRLLCQAAVVPPRAFFKEFGMPRSVRKELFFDAPGSRQTLREMFSDVRMLCHEVGLMNPVARLTWRLCKIDGRPSRYRGEPQRTRPPADITPLLSGSARSSAHALSCTSTEPACTIWT